MKKIAFVFPGQGAQFVGMGKELYDASKEAKEIYDYANNAFAEFHQDSPLIEIKSISEPSFNGPEDLLKRTVYTQPAILCFSLSLAAEQKKRISSGEIDNPKFTAGHSLGEFAALYMSDVLRLEDTINLVIKRAALMEQAPAGAMTAIVGLEENALTNIITNIEDASVANYNAPDQIVATGTKEAMQKLGEELNSYASANNLNIKVIPLSVGGAFHSPLMKEASIKFAQALDEVVFNNAKIPVIQNINAELVSDAASIKANLKAQMTGSVQWTKTVQKLISETDGVEEVWEIGPGKVLAGLIKKQNRRFPVVNI